jgi:hypothetical protein
MGHAADRNDRLCGGRRPAIASVAQQHALCLGVLRFDLVTWSRCQHLDSPSISPPSSCTDVEQPACPSSPSPLTASPLITNADAVTFVDALVLVVTLRVMPFCFPALSDPGHRGTGSLVVAFKSAGRRSGCRPAPARHGHPYPQREFSVRLLLAQADWRDPFMAADLANADWPEAEKRFVPEIRSGVFQRGDARC